MRASPAGFDELFEREYASIARVAFVILGSWGEAEDVAQDAFLEAFLHWRRVSSLDKPGAWIRRVAIRRAVRTRERGSRVRSLADEPIAIEPAEPSEMAGLLRALSPQQRAAVALHYLEDLSVVDTAEILGCSASTVRTHLQRARSVLDRAHQLEEHPNV